MDDAAMVAGAIEGDQEAFGSIYDRYASRIHDFLYGLLRDGDEAADVLHDTFLAAGARLHQLRDPSKLRPWLFAIARHQGLRRLDARARLVALGETEVIATGPGPADIAAQRELAELVAAAADGLSQKDRAVLDLHLRQGLDGQDLGDAMGVPATQAYVVLSRLRDQVERSLGALLVTRLGRGDCAGLEQVLNGWDGRFSPLMRKRVARHVDRCAHCTDVRSRAVSPLALLAAIPPVALPEEIRVRVLGDLDLVSHRGRPWSAEPGGFPPPITDAWPRRRVFVGAAATLLLLVGGPVVLSDPAGSPGPMAGLVDATTPLPSPPPGQLGGITPGGPPPSAQEEGAAGPGKDADTSGHVRSAPPTSGADGRRGPALAGTGLGPGPARSNAPPAEPNGPAADAALAPAGGTDPFPPTAAPAAEPERPAPAAEPERPAPADPSIPKPSAPERSAPVRVTTTSPPRTTTTAGRLLPPPRDPGSLTSPDRSAAQ